LCEDPEEKVYITGNTVCHYRRKRLDESVHTKNSLQKLQCIKFVVIIKQQLFRKLCKDVIFAAKK
jgi:hypothetical protein